MKKITLEEAKQIRYELLQEIDRFCTERNLTYFLAFGTLIGAVRHNGFIPWDDDCDIMMPRPDLERFLIEYETTDRFEAISNKSERGQVWGFGRLVDRKTFREQNEWKFPGINVEIYPIDGAPTSQVGLKCFLFGIKAFQFIERNIVSITDLLINTNKWPFKKPECFLTKLFISSFYIYGTMFDFNKSKYAAIIFGNPYEKKIFIKKYFSDSIPLKFENTYFKAPVGFDKYLTEIYGDYMTPPPYEKRISHGGNYYSY